MDSAAPPTRPTHGSLATKLLVALGLLAAVAAGALLWMRREPGAPPQPPEPGFVDVAASAGIGFQMDFLPGEQGAQFKVNLYDHGCGVAVGDADGDGRDDIYLLNQLGPNALYRNLGGRKFEDVAASAGAALGDRICTSAAFGDVDADGDQDLFVVSTRGGNVLLRNVGGGRFEDATEAAGLTLVAHSQGVAFFDVEGDGDLDLFVTNTADWTLDAWDPEGRYRIGPADLFLLVRSPPERNVLYRNAGDGTFVDATDEAGVAGDGWGGDVAVFDSDGDGDLDLFVTNMFGASTLYGNDGRGRFSDVTASTFGRTSWGAVGCRVLDFDVDGRLDLFVVDMHSDMWMDREFAPEEIDPRRKYAGPEGPMVELGRMSPRERQEIHDLVQLDASRVIFGNTLYRNLGEGRYDEVSDAAGVETLWPWGVAPADFDMDGDEDVFVPAGMGYPYFPWPNSLLVNRGDGTFEDRARAEGIEPRPGGNFLRLPIGGRPAARSSRSAAVLDFDEDGAPDLVVNNFNDRAFLLHNRFPRRHWVAFRLRATTGHPDAIGALVRIESGGRAQVRQVQAAGGYLAQSTRTLHFGLGDAETIDRCTVVWPGGAEQELKAVAVDAYHDVVQAAATGK